MFHFRKSASRGFEPTRDFGVLVTGFRQWWLPLRQRRGCGLRGAVRGELETDVGAPIPSILFSVSAFYAEPRVLVPLELPKIPESEQNLPEIPKRYIDLRSIDISNAKVTIRGTAQRALVQWRPVIRRGYPKNHPIRKSQKLKLHCALKLVIPRLFKLEAQRAKYAKKLAE